MKADDFRRLALRFPQATEGAHMGHPDFRIGGKIFATLSPGEEYGVVLLSPDEQKALIDEAPKSFSRTKGGWGRSGSTEVNLQTVGAAILQKTMAAAWAKKAPKTLRREPPPGELA